MALRVTVCQASPVLGDFERNAQMHQDAIEDAIARGTDLLVFPELSLTGYFVKDLVDDLAIPLEDPRLGTFLEASRHLDLVVGLIIRDAGARACIASLYLSGGQVLHVHRKVYLPTYGMFEERRFLAAGEAVRAFDTRLGRMAMLICEDAWHPSAVGIACADGADTLIVTAASPARGFTGDRPASARIYEDMNRVYAQLHGIHVIFANRVGFEDGVGFWGGSEIVDPFGDVLAKAPYFAPGSCTAELDASAQRRARLATPLWRDERLDLTLAELQRVVASRREARS